MAVNLYHNPNRNNNFKSAPIFSDWKCKSEPNKAGLLTFRSPQYLAGGDHVKLVVDGEPLFGGQILKPSSKKNDFYSFEALDYKHYLLREITVNKKNITTSNFVKLLSKKISVLKWNIGATKYKHPHLVFEGVTALSIINQLIWLEYKKAHNLMLFNVDHNANVTFKPYPTKTMGYIFTEALDYTSSLDYNDVRTGYELIAKDTGKVISSYTNKTLQAIWGDIRIQEVFDDDS